MVGSSLYGWERPLRSGVALTVGSGLYGRGRSQSQHQSCATAYNRLMWPTDLAMTNSDRCHTPHGLSWTKADHLAKVSCR